METNGYKFLVGISRNGFLGGGDYYYEQEACAGPRYILMSDIVPVAGFYSRDGSPSPAGDIYYPGQRYENKLIRSWGTIDQNGNSMGCTSAIRTLSVAKVEVWSVSFSIPFKMN